MPERTYMVVDPRRDHSMRVPRPDLSVVMGIPNACNSCHQDKNAQWALDTAKSWGVEYRDTGKHPARAFQRFDLGDRSVVPVIAALANDPSAAPIWRATALEALGQAGGREAIQSVTAVLYDDGRTYVFRVDGDVLAMQAVVPGRRVDGLQVIRDGIAAADSIVVRDVAALSDGQKVQAMSAPAVSPDAP
jgi:hypothetical protein